VWTEAVSGKKKLRIQKYPDTCEREIRIFTRIFSASNRQKIGIFSLGRKKQYSHKKRKDSRARVMHFQFRLGRNGKKQITFLELSFFKHAVFCEPSMKEKQQHPQLL